jgi:hypothetical protein
MLEPAPLATSAVSTIEPAPPAGGVLLTPTSIMFMNI